jgi:protein dithiol:quinone oxidoreductase
MKTHTTMGATALAAVVAVAAAWVSQHVFNMQPCPWCVLQRLLFLALAGVCAVGFWWRHRMVSWVCAVLGLDLALCGMAAAWWQHFHAAASLSCNLTLADKIISRWLHLDALLPQLFEARASCAEAAVNLLGVPYAFWSLALFAVMVLGLGKTLVDAVLASKR